MLPGEIAQALLVGFAQRLQMSEHQGHHRVATRQFNLRTRLACLHAANEFTQRHQQCLHMRGQNRAMRHVRHITAFALMKTHQHRALFVHIAHRESSAVAVAPVGALDGAQQGLGLDLAQVPEVVLQHTLLDGQLSTRVQMLHLASTAGSRLQAKVGTRRPNTLRGLTVQHLEGARLPLVFLAVHLHLHHLKGQCALDKHHLAIGTVRHPLSLQVERFDGQRLFRPSRSVRHGRGMGVQARRPGNHANGARYPPALARIHARYAFPGGTPRHANHRA